MSSTKLFLRFKSRLLQCAIFAILPTIANGSVSATIQWNPSPDSAVTGYNVYYGTISHDYTNMVPVGSVTNVAIDGLESGITYYFAATAHDAAGNQSQFSNEASFAGYNIAAGNNVRINTLPSALTNDLVTFTLGPGAPAGVSINPTNGILSWSTGLANANSTNSITITITDLTNPNESTQISLLLKISDYLNVALASVPVQTGQNASLPLTAICSDGVTNLIFNLKWPGSRLLNPRLMLNPPLTGGILQNQGTNLVIQLWSGKSMVPPGTNQIAQINFQAAPGQSSDFLELPASIVSASKIDGSQFSNVIVGTGEAVVVGTNPLLRPHFTAAQGRTLTLYANPGNTYQLQYTTEISSPANWQPLQTYTQSTLEQTVNLDSANPVVFYRLMQE